MSITHRFVFLIIFTLIISPEKLFAEPVWDAYTQVELITDISAVQPGRPFWVGVHLDMDDNWQTYWKNPGDSGLATAVQWDLPEGFKASGIHWPFPIRMDYPELTCYGYEGEVILLTEITPPEDLLEGSRQEIKAHVTWLACGNMCIPGKADLSLELSVQNEQPPVNQPIRDIFEKTMFNWPLLTSEWDIEAYDDEKFFRLHLIAPGEEELPLTEASFFPDRNDLIDHRVRQTLNKVEDGYDLMLPKAAIVDENASQLKGVLVSREGWQEGRRALLIDAPIRILDHSNRLEPEKDPGDL